MSVIRTPSGISNEHLFYGADAVVYVEGGKSGPMPDPIASSDLLFWSGLFAIFLKGRRFHFKPRCGKQTLLAIVDEIVNGTVKAAIVCLDRDQDHVTGLIRTTGILYTRGYSWENDVWTANVIEEEFYILSGVDRTSVPVRTRIDELIGDFIRKARWAVYADVLAAVCGRTVIPRTNLRCIIPPSGDWPRLDRGFLKDCVNEARCETAGTSIRLPNGVEVDVLRDVYGHLLASYCRRILTRLLQTNTGQSIRNDHADRFAIRIAKEEMPKEIADYYQKQLATLI